MRNKTVGELRVLEEGLLWIGWSEKALGEMTFELMPE